MNALEQEIFQSIKTSGGGISFARFMEMALYTPGLGYYERREHTPGRGGDFFTSVSVGSLFGQLLAAQFTAWRAGQSAPFQLVEAGAHDGRLAVDILDWLKSRGPQFYQELEYWIVEPSPRRQSWQRDILIAHAGKVNWAASLDALPLSLRGVIFSNELLDAFPTHRLGWDARQRRWFEWGVGVEAQRFVWQPLGTCPPDLQPCLAQELLAALPDGFCTEVCPSATAWWQQAARQLASGWLMTGDYGLTELEFFSPARAQGTLRAYHRHRQRPELLTDVGEQDLTGHVNFTVLQRAGESAGLKTAGLFRQAQFLAGIAAGIEQASALAWEWTPALRRQFQTLIHPDHLGHRFQVLVQHTTDRSQKN